MKTLETVLVFPNVSVAFGGVQMIRAGARKATITRADGSIVKVWRSQLPPPEKWSAFTLADAVDSIGRAGR